jgi:hypothetical protein
MSNKENCESEAGITPHMGNIFLNYPKFRFHVSME